MTYPRRSSIRKLRSGLILVDALLALSLAALFVATIASTSLTAQNVFDRASERATLLDAYEAHADGFTGMMPNESRKRLYASTTDAAASVIIEASAHWYGNDRIETDITVGYADNDTSDGQNISTSLLVIAFVQVEPYPFANPTDSAGTPLCSPDFMMKYPVGSYQFLQAYGLGGISELPPSISLRTPVPVITPITLPIDPLLPLTDLIVRDGIAYVSADSSVSSDPDLLIANIYDPKHPMILSSLNTGPGISAIALSGNHIFAAADSAAAELHVIRLNSLTSPVLAKRYRLPLPQASSSPSVGVSIFYDRNTIYLGTDKWDGQEFSAIDVTSPEAPVQVGSFEAGSKVNGIFVRNGVAYVADSDQSQLRVLDVSDRTAPRMLYSFSPSGWQRQAGESVSSFEDAPIFGRTSGGYDITTDYELFSWPPIPSLPAASVPTSSAPFFRDVPGGVYGVVADRRRVYAATRTVGQEFSVYDRPLGSSTAAYYQLPVAPQTITCDEDHLYILSHTAPVIYEVAF